MTKGSILVHDIEASAARCPSFFSNLARCGGSSAGQPDLLNESI
jgi:hypothetical protein